MAKKTKRVARNETPGMKDDPIIAEIRKFREEYAARFNYDIDAMVKDIRSREGKDGRPVVSLRPRLIPAVGYARVSLARKIIRERKFAGLSQAALARLASIRPETLNRIERGRTTPDTATIAKIERALETAQEDER